MYMFIPRNNLSVIWLCATVSLIFSTTIFTTLTIQNDFYCGPWLFCVPVHFNFSVGFSILEWGIFIVFVVCTNAYPDDAMELFPNWIVHIRVKQKDHIRLYELQWKQRYALFIFSLLFFSFFFRFILCWYHLWLSLWKSVYSIISVRTIPNLKVIMCNKQKYTGCWTSIYVCGAHTKSKWPEMKTKKEFFLIR